MKRSRKTRRANRNARGAILLHSSQMPVNLAQAQLAAEVDEPADKRWFDVHRHARYRVRAASPREIAALNLPFGSRLIAFRLADGSHIRLFVGPHRSVDEAIAIFLQRMKALASS